MPDFEKDLDTEYDDKSWYDAFCETCYQYKKLFTVFILIIISAGFTCCYYDEIYNTNHPANQCHGKILISKNNNNIFDTCDPGSKIKYENDIWYCECK